MEVKQCSEKKIRVSSSLIFSNNMFIKTLFFCLHNMVRYHYYDRKLIKSCHFVIKCNVQRLNISQWAMAKFPRIISLIIKKKGLINNNPLDMDIMGHMRMSGASVIKLLTSPISINYKNTQIRENIILHSLIQFFDQLLE